MLKLAGVAKFYGQKLVFKGINLELAPASVLLLLGGNGSGKSTLMKIMAGLCRPSAGSIENNIHPSKVAYLGHQTFIYPALSALENLLFWGALHCLQDNAASKAKLQKSAEAALERVELLPFAQEKAGTFSRGMAQRLNLARVFMQEPELLLLDEPGSGLDVRSGALLQREVCAARERGAATVWISHNLSEDLPLANQVLALGRGKAIFYGQAVDFKPELVFSGAALTLPVSRHDRAGSVAASINMAGGAE